MWRHKGAGIGVAALAAALVVALHAQLPLHGQLRSLEAETALMLPESNEETTVEVSGIFCNSGESAAFVASQFRAWAHDGEQTRVRMALHVQQGRARAASDPIQRWRRALSNFRTHPLWCQVYRKVAVQKSGHIIELLGEESDSIQHSVITVEVAEPTREGRPVGKHRTLHTLYFVVDSDLR